ncbi:alkaline phosphatase PhoX [Streptosporangium sp. NPDC048047]|uniref:alkaline phosphatase PhoX n=1 Tax=Streptosporangium sp. NPDC048047 TaxID=3155748 RepID=UPI003443E71B
MSAPVSRRSFLGRSAAGGLGIALAGSIEAIAETGTARAATRTLQGYGPLVPDPAGLFSLPAGFSYRIVAEAGVTLLDSGEPTPSDPDGMAWFARRGGGALVCNHEIVFEEPYAVPTLPRLTYDPGARGGTTTIELTAGGERVREYVSLAGTLNNCAGGRTPWNSWLSCEEAEYLATGPLQKDHGYVFEVHALDQEANLDPVPLKFLGRYAHEAVAVDPLTYAVYLTEDADSPNGLYYRWLPPQRFRGGKGALRALALSPGGDTAGQLQVMSCYEGRRHVNDLSEATRPGTTYQVRWVDVPDRDARTTSIRRQLTNDQVTRAHKLEGAYWGEGGAYFVSSFARASDGSAREHDGQVWFYDPRTGTATLKTIFGVNPDPATGYDGPDNITLSPHGGLILAEDGEGYNHLVGVTRDGVPYLLARHEASESELSGPTFNGDGSILFANIYSPGHVLAITGPWKRT